MRQNISNEITLCLTADICNAIFPEHREPRRWDTIMCTGIRYEETLEGIRDDFGNNCRITWFVRADPWMRKRFGSATYLFERHGAHLSRLQLRGHEIAWHPHLDMRSIYEDIKELPRICSQVREGFPVKSVRVGEGYHSVQLMKILQDLKFTADSTALPGRVNSECRTPFDWRGTPEYPYYPSVRDYRLEGTIKAAGLLEIPFTMLPIRLPDDRPGLSSRYMNFSYRREYFQAGVMAKREWPEIVVGITHPAEVTPPRGYDSHRILSFSEEEPIRNIRFLIEWLQSLGKRVCFRTIGQVSQLRQKQLAMAGYIEGEKAGRSIFQEAIQ